MRPVIVICITTALLADTATAVADNKDNSPVASHSRPAIEATVQFSEFAEAPTAALDARYYGPGNSQNAPLAH